MVYASFTMAQAGRIATDNPLGRTAHTIEEIVSTARLRDFTRTVGGITLQRFAGALPNNTGRAVGDRVDGKIIDTMTVGSFDDYRATPEDFAGIAELRALGYAVRVYVGFPVTIDGVRALFDWPHDAAQLVLDMSGCNLATAPLVKRAPFMVEPHPRPALRCEWFADDQPSFTMFGYFAEMHPYAPSPAPHHVVAFNGNPRSPNHYNAAAAAGLEALGYTVDVPAGFLR